MKQVILRKNGTKRVTTVIDEPSATDPSFKKDCDVNEIVKRYMKTGLLPQNKVPGVYQDTTQLPDLATAMNVVSQANTAFDDLPSNIRKRFSNDPRELIEFLQDSQNDDEAVKLGLKVKKPVLDSQNQDGDKRKRVQSSQNDSKPPKKAQAPVNDDLNDDN